MTALAIVLLVTDAPASPPAPSDDSIFAILEEQEQVGIKDASGRTIVLREAPGSHWVLDQSALQNTPAWDLYDVLHTLPGMIPRQLSLTQTEANFRADTGTPDLETLMVIDGRSVSSDGAGAFYDRQLLNLRDIERVEVVNGPSSTLYGPNALFGVISVTRKKPQTVGDDLTFALDGGIASGAPTSSQKLTVAPLGRIHASYDHGWGDGGLRLSTTGDYLPAFGYLGDSGRISHNPGERVTGTVDALENVRGWQLRAQADGAYKTSDYEIIEGGRVDQSDVSLNLLAEKDKLAGSDDRLVVNAWARHYTINLTPNAAFAPATSFATNITSVELRSVYALPTFHGNSLTVGAQARLSLNDASYPLLGPVHQFLTGIFAEDTYRPIRQLVLTAGVRLDNTATFGLSAFREFHVSPRGAITWLISDKHSVRVEYASAFRTPVIIESDAVLSPRSGQPFVVGNPQLQDESIDGFLLGYMGEVGWASLRLEGYVSHARHNIAPFEEAYGSSNFTGPAGQPLYQPASGGRYKYPFYLYNLDEFWIPGALARLDLKPRQNLHFFVNYTYQPIEVQHYAAIGGDFRYRRLLLSAQAYFNDQPELDSTVDHDLPGRIMVNARAAYTLDAAGRFTIALSVMNGFDIHFFYYRRPGVPADYGDKTTGERLGPRAFVTFELHPFGSTGAN